MFFRPIPVSNDISYASCFILENHEGFLGKVIFLDHAIFLIEIQSTYYLDFLKMIEEYLWMKYSFIVLINPLPLISLEEYGWHLVENIYTKYKPDFIDRQYNIEVEISD